MTAGDARGVGSFLDDSGSLLLPGHNMSHEFVSPDFFQVRGTHIIFQDSISLLRCLLAVAAILAVNPSVDSCRM